MKIVNQIRAYLLILLFSTLNSSCGELDPTDQKRAPYFWSESSLVSAGDDPATEDIADTDMNPEPDFDSFDEFDDEEDAEDLEVSEDERIQDDVAQTDDQEEVAETYRCSPSPFRQSMVGNFSSSVPLGFFTTTINARANLTVDNRPGQLLVNLGVSDLSVSPSFAQPSVNASLQALVGMRLLRMLKTSEREALSKRGDDWAALSCEVAFVKTYKVPTGNQSSMTIEFSPALPWAVYPDQMNQELLDRVGNSLRFAGIQAKVIEVEGSAPKDIQLGSRFQGSVRLDMSRSVATFDYDFGNRANLAKLSIFDRSVYRFRNQRIDSLDLTILFMEGQQSTTVRFADAP